MVPSSRHRPPMQTLDLMMKLVVIFALSWFLYVSFINRPSLPTPELQSAAHLLKEGNAVLAHTQFDRFLAAQPRASAAAYVQVCLVCQEAHRFDLMAEYAQRGTHACANVDSADRAQLYAKLAIALSESGKAHALPARAAARQAQVLDPDNPEILNEAGYVLADTTTDVADLTDAEKRTAIADLKDAETMIARALTTLSDRAGAEYPSGFLGTVEDSYGWVLYKQGLVGPSAQAPEAFARAVTALLQATSDLPTDADPEAAKIVYYHLGAAYHQAGQLDAARDSIAESLRYDPHYADALAEQRSLVLASQAPHPVPSSPATAHAFTPLRPSTAESQIKL